VCPVHVVQLVDAAVFFPNHILGLLIGEISLLPCAQGVEGASRHCGILYGLGVDSNTESSWGAKLAAADNGSS
jgi:hypothetical protein